MMAYDTDIPRSDLYWVNRRTRNMRASRNTTKDSPAHASSY